MNHCRRRGKTLIEMLVVIVAMSAVLSTAGQMLYRLSRSERMVRDASAIARAEMRLARTFRSDARAASSAEPLEDPAASGVRFDTPAGLVTWRVAEEEVQRTVEQGDAPRRDAFRLGPVIVSFEVEEDRLAVIHVEPQRPAGTVIRAAAGPLEVVAAIGADRPDRSPDSATLPAATRPVEAPRQAEEASR